MKDTDIRAVALFFFFVFSDEGVAAEAAAETVRRLRGSELDSEKSLPAARLVTVTREVWRKYRRRLPRGRAYPVHNRYWALPEGVEIGPWRDFQKSATDDELLSVVWTKILGISEEDIARGLALSEGTVRYRLGRAFRKIGGFVSSQPRPGGAS